MGAWRRKSKAKAKGRATYRILLGGGVHARKWGNEERLRASVRESLVLSDLTAWPCLVPLFLMHRSYLHTADPASWPLKGPTQSIGLQKVQQGEKKK